MKKVIRLNENDLERLVNKIIKEEKKSINEIVGECSYCGSDITTDDFDAENTRMMRDGKRYYTCSNCGASQTKDELKNTPEKLVNLPKPKIFGYIKK